jgi:RecQ family ATP-dependent DNA helicase
MEEQVGHLLSLGINAAAMSSNQTTEESCAAIGNLYNSNARPKLLYVTPERMVKSGGLATALKFLQSKNLLSRFVIDESHCVSEWGHDFRPQYRELNKLKINFPTVPITALTATATPQIIEDIINTLKLNVESSKFIFSFDRPNLYYEVRKKNKSCVNDIATFINEKKNDCGIIYCQSRKECERLCDELALLVGDTQITYYHAGISI